VHMFDAAGEWVSFTYDDHVLTALEANNSAPAHDINQRNVGVSVPIRPVKVLHVGPRNHDGSSFSALVTQTVNQPRPGSDEISRGCEEGWVGTSGYLRADGTRQRRALAFQGTATTKDGNSISEVFIVDLPEDVTLPGDHPLEGTKQTRPAPPRGTQQRRLTYTTDRKHPGLQGPRHWIRSSADGSQIAFLMRDDAGVVQIWTVSPNAGAPQQITHNPFDVASAFTWNPAGDSIAYVADNSIFTVSVETGISTRVTPRSDDRMAPRPEACVFSPDGKQIAFVKSVKYGGTTNNQIFTVKVE
jgi:hypothetical protein